jgi:hypothetical protein
MNVLRIAVHEVEAWLLADPERFAAFLGVPAGSIPTAPETRANPKQSVVEIAGRSRRRDIRADILPRIGSSRREGPGYASRMIEFVLDKPGGWRPEVAASRADSLRRCLAAVRTLVADT